MSQIQLGAFPRACSPTQGALPNGCCCSEATPCSVSWEGICTAGLVPSSSPECSPGLLLAHAKKRFGSGSRPSGDTGRHHLLPKALRHEANELCPGHVSCSQSWPLRANWLLLVLQIGITETGLQRAILRRAQEILAVAKTIPGTTNLFLCLIAGCRRSVRVLVPFSPEQPPSPLG